MKRRRLGLGGQLLLYSSILLAIPWLGYRYTEEMKQFLLTGQEEAQLLAGQAVAVVLQDRADLFTPAGGQLDTTLEQKSLFVYPLEDAVQIDGYASDWSALMAHRQVYAAESTLFSRSGTLGDGLSFSLLLGERNGHIYGFLQVEDKALVYRHPRYRRLDNSDHVRLALMGPSGETHRYVLVTEGQGTTSAYEVGTDWRYPANGQAVYELYGAWRESSNGYHLEFRFPASWLGKEQRLSVSVVNVNDPAERAIETVVATLPKEWSGTLNRLIVRSPELNRILHGLSRADARMCVVDRYRRVRAVMGGEAIQAALCADTDKISQDLVQDALAGRSKVLHRNGSGENEQLIVAAHPVYAGGEVTGAVLLEKNSAHILSLQRATLNHLALSTLLVLLILVAGLLMFGAWLALRIRRLKHEAAAAIDSNGRIVKILLESDHTAQDDLGDLSRDISDLLARLQRYTGFLESVPRTLRHEILNPVNTIAMSLQKLDATEADNKPALIKSAQQATRQLEHIVNSLTEAAHIEDALKADISTTFDLAALVGEYVHNRSQLHPDRQLVYQGPPAGRPLRGSDLRMAQLLDKLVDNALDFSSHGSPVVIQLNDNDKRIELSVLNQGPAVPWHVLESLFVGMTSHRPRTDGAPHLGIGLFIAKQIAVHHGGDLEVANRRDGSGVRVTVCLPSPPPDLHPGTDPAT